ncbi:MAG: hypothetical protein AB1503_13355 [Bacillota bacterium]|nr:hypothetical protein [Bacillota bacterium]
MDRVLLRLAGDDLEVRVQLSAATVWKWMADIEFPGGEGQASTVRCHLSFRAAR